jgi:hypothetical protein
MSVSAPPPAHVGTARPLGTVVSPESFEHSDAECLRILKQGALFGTPVVYAIVAGVCWLAAPGHHTLFLAMLWPALFAGWYFGAMVALTVCELRQERAHRREQEVPDTSARPRPALTRPPVPAH